MVLRALGASKAREASLASIPPSISTHRAVPSQPSLPHPTHFLPSRHPPITLSRLLCVAMAALLLACADCSGEWGLSPLLPPLQLAPSRVPPRAAGDATVGLRSLLISLWG